jgi:hypothetical protein
MARFDRCTSAELPPSYSDHRCAWEGKHAESQTQIRVEAASYGGQAVFFKLIWPDRTKQEWTALARSDTPHPLAMLVFLIVIMAGAVMARHNLRLGIADRKGALRIALCLATISMLIWIFGASHVPNLSAELSLVFSQVWDTCGAVIPWVLYLALEPYVRRLWPESLISWGRLLTGRLNDPLVGRDLLMGATVGASLPVLSFLVYVVSKWLAAPEELNAEVSLYTLMGGRHLAVGVLGAMSTALFMAPFWLLVLVLMRFLLRNQWLASAVIVALWTALITLGSGSYVFAIQVAVNLVVVAFVLIRFGLLALAATLFSFFVLHFHPITSDFNAWYWQTSLICLAVVAAIGLYGFYASWGGRISLSPSSS